MDILVLTAPLSLGLSTILKLGSPCKELQRFTSEQHGTLLGSNKDVFDQFSNILVCEDGFRISLSISDLLKNFPIDDEVNEAMYVDLMLSYPEKAHLFI